MSNPDSFINEVTEEVRRDKLFAFFRRYGWIAVLAAVAIVGGAAWNEWQKARAETAAQGFGDAVLTALDSPDAATRAAELAAVPATDGRVAVLDFIRAADAIKAGDRLAALAALDALAADTGLPQSYRDLALLKRVMLAGAEMPAADRIAALDALATPGRPFRPLALEQKAMVQIETGATADGLTGLKAVLEEPQISQALRARVTQVMVALGADPKAG